MGSIAYNACQMMATSLLVRVVLVVRQIILFIGRLHRVVVVEFFSTAAVLQHRMVAVGSISEFPALFSYNLPE